MLVTSIVFYILAAISLILAVFVLIFRNPVYAALSLVGTMLSLGGIFLVLGSPFVAMIQILIYAGAIMVLFLFVIMLLNLKTPNHSQNENKHRRMLALLFGFLFFGQTVFIIGAMIGIPNFSKIQYPIHNLFVLLMTKYLLPFEMISVLILIAIAGAVFISMPEKKLGEEKQ